MTESGQARSSHRGQLARASRPCWREPSMNSLFRSREVVVVEEGYSKVLFTIEIAGEASPCRLWPAQGCSLA